MTLANKKRKRKTLTLTVLIVGIVVALAVVLGGSYYKRIFTPNIHISNTHNPFLYIATGSNFQSVEDSLVKKGWLLDKHSFEWVANKKSYSGGNVVPGKYRLRDGMSNNELINELRAGRGSVQVEVVVNNLRTLDELAGDLTRNLEPDSLAMDSVLRNPQTAQHYGFSRQNFLAMFIPDTYYFFWNTQPDSIVARMAREYKKFWTPQRKQLARNIGLSQTEVSILASIVQAEQSAHPDERPRVAGLYLNRLHKGIRLQSDPTVIYAQGDFTRQRVLTKDLQFDSPYNTYLYAGLPPGPINLPDKQSIDAVLHAEKNNYLFMCARADFSGYHNFSASMAEHMRNAREYQKALRKAHIFH